MPESCPMMTRHRSLVARTLALAGALVALPHTTVGAQAIGGRVVEEGSRRPLPGVPVSVVRAGPPRDTAAADTTRQAALDTVAVARSVTDREGTFVLLVPEPGRWQLRIGASYVAPPLTLATADASALHDFVVPPLGVVRAERDVDVPVRPRSTIVPRYPQELRDRGVEGDVRTSFVVSETGEVVRGTLRILASSDPLFSEAVRMALLPARFHPAQLKGQPVRQVVQQPFSFRLTMGSPPPGMPSPRPRRGP
jgi:TonB family protein